MIKLKHILEKQYYETKPRSVSIDLDEALELFKNNCEYFTGNSNYWIYRGVESLAQYMFVSPSNFTRRSANTYNYYTILLDNSPYWKNYPKRSKSIICSTSESTARNYGTYGKPYVVIPFSGAKIASCPGADFWTSFAELEHKNIFDVDDFNNKIRTAYYYLRNDGLAKFNDLDGNDASKFFKSLEDFDTKESRSALDIYKKNYSDSLIQDWLHSGLTFTEYLFEITRPEKNNFTLTSVENFRGDVVGGVEVWTDSDSLLISIREIHAFLQSAGMTEKQDLTGEM